MNLKANIPGAVLPTVLVVSTLMMLTVIALVSLWETDFVFFSRGRYTAMQRANVASGFTLYSEHPQRVMERLDADSTLQLFDSVPHSRIEIGRTPWGLYEKVTITAHDGKTRSTKILGRRSLAADEFSLYYRNRNSAVTLTGKTRIKGRAKMPSRGVIYGQMGSVFFDGEKIPAAMLAQSTDSLPARDTDAVAVVRKLLAAATADITISGSGRLRDTIVVGHKVRVKSGFRGSIQVFARDSLIVEPDVMLEYPSGLFSEKIVTLGNRSTVNGYVVVEPAEKPNPRYANYVQSRLATVRGLVYVAGMAQIQGIVSGAVIVDKAAFYSPRGYYENMMADVTILENREMAWPLWTAGPPQRKEIKWVD